MKSVKVIKNDDNIFETHILGDVAVTEKLADYEFPGFSGFYAFIRLDEYPMLGIDSGYMYIFLDLLGYYSEEYGEYSLVPMVYYTKEAPSIIFDGFNEANSDLTDIDSMYMLDDGSGFEIKDNGEIRINDADLLKFFSSFDNDIKEVLIKVLDIREDKFSEAAFNIFK